MLTRALSALASRYRSFQLRLRGAKIEGTVWLRSVEVPRQAHRIALGAGAALDRGATLLLSGSPQAGLAIRIGRRVYINRHTILDATEAIEVGDDCMIGPCCYITDHDHEPGPDGRPASGPLRARPVKIQARAWIGAHVTILKGVTIGENAVVGAGSVVTKDVLARTVVVGNPARPLPRSPAAS